jgi:cephalosporin-C deacetylase
MLNFSRRMLIPIVACFLIAPAASAQIVAIPLKPDGIYEVGEKVAWTIETRAHKAHEGKNPGPDVNEVSYVLKRDGETPYKEGTLDVSAGPASLETSLDGPGAILLELGLKGGQRPTARAGALVAPGKIQPLSSKPADFDEFWAAKLKDLAAVPANPQAELADGGSPDVDYFKLRMDNVNGSHIHGQLAKPKKEGKFPALLILQWAGVYGLPKDRVTGRAKQGWLALNIEPHDLPFDRPNEFYQDASRTTLRSYHTQGNDDREKSYFLRMYLSCYRAAEFLAGHPDWDGKTLVVLGTSMGGQQSFAAAGLHQKVSVLIANVPAGCDVTGPKFGRAAGFPGWAAQARAKKDDRILEVGRYYDPANFAPRFKGPALVAMGLIDETCPPAGVYAALNQLGGQTEPVVMVTSGHQNVNNSQAPFNTRSETWLRSLANGEKIILSK